ncbi:hypothetical protein Aca07nite_87120 [Actinoplanes capillaceus]|uniref:Uncharacterized protein n=1 Tax=Actinoplanes campanulatus TaxID=113559 RepID=A0ABQ3WYZ8_9ACTN|nr:hypothetical protein Aca07nite_87120 [Actinoplanes capillaceus]
MCRPASPDLPLRRRDAVSAGVALCPPAIAACCRKPGTGVPSLAAVTAQAVRPEGVLVFMDRSWTAQQVFGFAIPSGT